MWSTWVISPLNEIGIVFEETENNWLYGLMVKEWLENLGGVLNSRFKIIFTIMTYSSIVNCPNCLNMFHFQCCNGMDVVCFLEVIIIITNHDFV